MDELIDEDFVANKGEQYFLFLSGDSLYALEVLSVREIVEYQAITKVPYLDRCVKGVTNIRGNIVAVIDLSSRFDFADTLIQERTSFAIVEVFYQDSLHEIALMIDEIYEVDALDHDSFCSTPLFGNKIQTDFIKGLGRYDDKEVCILNQDELLKISELSQIKDAS